VITLDGLSSDRSPPFIDLHLTVAPRELPVVVCPDDDERLAFVNLLLGHTPESSGRFLNGDEPLDATQRKDRVAVLHREDALSPDLSIVENIELVGALRGLHVDAALRTRLLSFARIPNGKLKPEKLPAEARLRLTLALNALGSLVLLIAFDPPPEVARILPDILDDRRALLVVVGSLPGLEAPITRIHTLAHSRLDSDSGEAVKPQGRRYRFRVVSGSPRELLAAHPGVTVSQAPNGEYVLDLDAQVSGSRLIRLMVQAGISVDSIREDLNRPR
jgi:hypothetical protein